MRWSPPSQPNGIITGYQVIYSVYQIPSTKMISNMLDNTITEFFIENLSKQLYITNSDVVASYTILSSAKLQFLMDFYFIRSSRYSL